MHRILMKWTEVKPGNRTPFKREPFTHPCMKLLHILFSEITLGHAGLVGNNHEKVSSLHSSTGKLEDTREEPNTFGMDRIARVFVDYSIPVEKDSLEPGIFHTSENTPGELCGSYGKRFRTYFAVLPLRMLTMKIAHYAYDHVDNPRCGGGGAYHELMVHGLLSQDNVVTMYCGRFPGATAHTRNGLPYRFLGWGNNYALSRITFALAATIHSWFVRADVVVVGYSVYAPVLAFLARPGRTVLELYHLTGAVPFKKYGPLGLLPWMAEQLAITRARYFLTLTEAMTQTLTRRGKAIVSRVTNTGIAPGLARGNAREENYILYFGRIDIHMKGIDILLDAFTSVADRIPTTRLVLGGRGSDQDIEKVRDRIDRSTASDRITLKIGPTDVEKRTLLNEALFLCAPSRFEGWNIVAVEAASCGKAVLGTLVTGLMESVADGKTGILVPPGDRQALGDMIVRMCEDRMLRSRLGEAGKARAKEFTWEKVAHVHEEMYFLVARSNRSWQRVRLC